MALITCPDCNREVSDRAPACPGCGRPMHDSEAVVIEQTSKPFKAWMLVGLAVALFGFISTGFSSGGGASVGVFLMLIGVVTFVIALIAAWWNHG